MKSVRRPPKFAGDSIYMLANNSGKQRADVLLATHEPVLLGAS